MLFVTAESFPTHRVDVAVLFGRGFLGRGHAIDLVMQAGSEVVPTGRQPWHGRSVFVGRTRDGSGVLEITGIISALFGTLLTGPALPAFLLAGATVTFTVNSDPAFTDLRGTGFTVQTSCGDQSGVFPVA